MKKKKVIIIGSIITLALAWFIQSLREFYSAGQTLSLLTYIKNITTDKLINFTIFLTPAIFSILYFVLKQRRSKGLAKSISTKN